MQSKETLATVRTALIWTGAFALAFLLWQVRHGLLIVFAGLLLALLLRSIAAQFERIPGIGPRLGISLSILLVTATVLGTAALFGTQIAGRVGQVVHQVEEAARNINVGSESGGMMQSLGQTVSSEAANMLSGIVTMALSAAEAVLLIAVTGLYFAVDPELYRRGALKLVSKAWEARVSQTLDLLGRALVLWLLGQLVLMIMVGLLSYAALWGIGLPNAAGLGLVAGITEMVPYLGPFIGAVPAVLVAATLGLHQVVWTVAAYLLVHLVEGYIVAPLIQRRFITIPPAIVLVAIILSELLFGLPGALLAAPLAIVCYVVVKVLYVRGVLHRETELPSEGRSQP